MKKSLDDLIQLKESEAPIKELEKDLEVGGQFSSDYVQLHTKQPEVVSKFLMTCCMSWKQTQENACKNLPLIEAFDVLDPVQYSSKGDYGRPVPAGED